MALAQRRKSDSCHNDQPRKRRRPSPARAHRRTGRDGNDTDAFVAGADDLGTGRKTLACPYYKRSPTQFTRCMFRNQLTSTSFVLQHLARCHRQPIHCPICLQTFDEATERERHLRQQACVQREGSLCDGLTADQLVRLRQRPRRGMTEADRWYAIWDVLFPDQPVSHQPDWPYISSPEDEILRIACQAMPRICPAGTSSQLLEKLNWSTVSSAFENATSAQSPDEPRIEADSLSWPGAPSTQDLALLSAVARVFVPTQLAPQVPSWPGQDEDAVVQDISGVDYDDPWVSSRHDQEGGSSLGENFSPPSGPWHWSQFLANNI